MRLLDQGGAAAGQSGQRIAIYAAALLLGAAFAIWLLTWPGIWPPSPMDLAQQGDGAMSTIGQRYFLAAPWGWPLLRAPALAAPDGTNIGLTDSVPLAMLLLKLVRAWLPPGFYLQAGWLFVVWTLQPAAAVYALRGAGVRAALPALAVALLALNMPVLLIRAGHVALCSEAMILLALGVYLRLARGGRTADWAVATALPAACLLIHPYILALVTGILFAVPLNRALCGQPWRGAAAWFGAVVAVVFAGAALLGYTGTQTISGFGFYSMNLLGLVLPSHSLLFGNRAIDATGGQGLEGMVWPGAGLWLLALVVAVRRGAGLHLRRHAGLLAVLAGMAVFALSTKIYAGRHLIADLGDPPALVAQFRATGRFVWPLLYAGMLAGVVCAARSLARGMGLAVLAAACVLQIVDVTPLRNDLWHGSRPPFSPWAIDKAALKPVFAAHTHLVLWPGAGCGLHAEDAQAMQVLLLASETVLPTNTMYGGRPTRSVTCDAAAVLGQTLAPGEVRVVLNPQNAWRVPGAADACRRSGALAVCATDISAWGGLAPLALPDLAAGPGAIVAEDWAEPGSDGAVWTEGPAPVLRFTSAGGALVMDVVGLAPAAGAAQHVTAWIGDAPAGAWDLPDLAPAMIRLAVPPGAVTVRFQVAHPTRPVDRGINGDPRRLGMLLRAVRLDPPA